MSLGAGDFSSALEVKPDSPADPKDAASASDEGKPNGDAAEDRKALNHAKEALKVAQRTEGQLSQLANMIALQNQNANPATAPAEAPAVNMGDLKEALAAGDSDAVVSTLDKIIRERTDAARQGAVADSDRNVQARDLRTRLVTDLGLADPNREENRQIFALADQLQRDYPANFGKDPAGAQLAASAMYYRKAARGEIDIPDDLRAERLDKAKEPAGGDAAAPPEPSEKAIEPDWNARNRGLPAEMVKQLESWNLGEILQPSKDEHTERVARETLLGFLDDGTHGG